MSDFYASRVKYYTLGLAVVLVLLALAEWLGLVDVFHP
jgi:hypothetical protein